MEFSFDRSRSANTNTNNSNQQSASSASDEVDTSQIANERLRKAIERNRARQRERESQGGPRQAPSTTSSNNSAWAQHQSHATMSNPRDMEPEVKKEPVREPVRESYREQPVREAAREHVHAHENVHHARSERPAQAEHVQESFFEQKSPPPRPEVVEPSRTQASANATNAEEVIPTRTPSRRSVARPEDTEFAPTVKRTTKRAAAQISYTTGTKKKGKELDPKLLDYLVKGTWLFCGFLVLRLIFASGGVTDYFSQKSVLNDRLSELSRIKNENMGLVSEIERMQLDAGYQKKLVRDNLGFIAPDEYLVLFPKD